MNKCLSTAVKDVRQTDEVPLAARLVDAAVNAAGRAG